MKLSHPQRSVLKAESSKQQAAYMFDFVFITFYTFYILYTVYFHFCRGNMWLPGEAVSDVHNITHIIITVLLKLYCIPPHILCKYYYT